MYVLLIIFILGISILKHGLGKILFNIFFLFTNYFDYVMFL